MESRNQVFQKLKPPCVSLSEAALALSGPRGDLDSVTDRLDTLRRLLASIVAKPHSLDAKLADYVFFPLSNVLKVSQKLSVRCLELSLQCLAVLIDHGWRHHVQPQLAAQIVILCTLLAERKPKGLSFTEATDELQTSAFWCLYHLFSAVGESADLKSLLTSESNFPQLGQTISVTLDGIYDGASVEVQVAASHTLEALAEHVMDREIHAAFLPGIVSKLTRVLTPQTKQRRNYRVLIGCIDVLRSLLSSTLGRDRATPVPGNGKPLSNRASKDASRTIIDAEWQEKAAEQLKPALTNIMRLKSHGREDVKSCLGRLCLMLLQQCRQTLANCSSMALDTLILLLTESGASAVRIELETLVREDPSLSRLLQNTLYEWLQSLVTIMQGSDGQAKSSKLMQISTAYELSVGSGADTSTLERLFANTLRDSVVVTLTLPGVKQKQSPLVSPIQSLDLAILADAKGVTEFTSPLVQYRGQEEAMEGIEYITRLISSSSSSSDFAADLVRSLRYAQGEAQIADFWLLLTATQTALRRKDEIVDLLNFDDDSLASYTDHVEELYSFSLSILTKSSDETPDPRLQALALRALALRAQVAGREFRYELIDALYPVLHTLATPDEQLQRDSITALNIFTSASEYASVKDLIVENVDYLTNAVALKLNSFDVSPQAPQVLLMMVRLAGPSLLPYLEDTVESIFAALEDYHGYPLLVELLFKVLGVMAEEGAKAPQLAITDVAQSQINEAKANRWVPTTFDGLASLLKLRAEEEQETAKMDAQKNEGHPRRPWSELTELNDQKSEGEEDDDGDDQSLNGQDQRIDDAEPPPPAPKTYSLLFKITELTQHFLPSASPSLRTALLTLIRTTVPAIARHENSFLPLINTLWPEIVSRLDDDEPHVVATALDIVRILCEYARDFMRSRILQLWSRLVEIHRQTAGDILQLNRPPQTGPRRRQQQQPGSEVVARGPALQQAISKMHASPADYADTSSRLLWSALTGALTTIVEQVPLPPDVFDEALEMLDPVMEREEVRSALTKENADAVWLADVKSGRTAKPRRPALPEGVVWSFAEAPG